MATTKTRARAKSSRDAELKMMLETRRRELVHEVQARMRDARTDPALDREVTDQGDIAEADNQFEIDFALMEMKAQTLKKIEEALRRLWEGTYGDCSDCGDEIAEARLVALPFAARCKDCEQARETRQRRHVIANGGPSMLG